MRKNDPASLTGKVFSFLGFFLLSVLVGSAQIPQYSRGTGAASSNVPMNTGGSHTQQIYLPSDFSTLPVSGQITRIYFRNSVAGATATYTDFSVSFTQNTSITFPNDTYLLNLTTALDTSSITINGNAAAGGWYVIPLTVPFTYDNTQSLVVEIKYNTKTGGIDNFTSTTTGSNRRLFRISPPSAIKGTLSTLLSDFGMDVTSAAPCTSPPVPGVITTNPSSTVCGNSPVNLDISGNSSGVGQTYQWQRSPTSTGTYTSISGLQASPAFTTTIPVGTSYYRCAVTCGGNTAYTDVVSITGKPILAGGTYTINATQAASGTNFQSFGSAVSALSCGITGPVVFNVTTTDATYNEQVIIPQITGASAINTITFNGNGNTLSYTSSNSEERAVVKLNGADHITLDSLVMNATGSTTSEYGFGLQLINNADSNTIKRCRINSDMSLTSNNYGAVVISSSASEATASGPTLCDGNLLTGNTITGGFNGITLVGGTGSLITGNRILNNIIKDFYSIGIYASFTDNALIEGNIITRPDRTVLTTFYGIYLTGANTNIRISKNIIRNVMGGNNANVAEMFGISLEGSNGIASNPNLITNNLLYDFNGAGAIHGLYNTSSAYSHYFHNTIVLDNNVNTSASITRGFSQLTSNTGIEFKNNVIVISRGGGGTNHAIYLPARNTVISNHNNLYAPGSSTSYVGSFGSNFRSLADWQSGSGQDINSVSLDPQFTAPSSGNFLPVNGPAFNNLGIPVGVTTDIKDMVRSAAAPDLGAYENAQAVCIDPPVAGTITTSTSQICVGIPFTLRLLGGSSGISQTYQWQSSPNNITYTDIAGATAPSVSITQSQDSLYYRCVVTCGSTSFSDTLKLKASLCYCSSIPVTIARTGDTEIFGVTFNGVTQSSDCGIIAPGPGSVLTSYSNFYPNGPLSTVLQGSTIPFSILQEDCARAAYSAAACAIWIDYNRDGDFTDAGEKVFVENVAALGPRSINGSILIPVTATTGITGMRIILAQGFSGDGLQPCMSYTLGETEDYLINIISTVPCSGVPLAGSAISSKVYVCASEVFNLSVTGYSLAAGLGFQWQSSPDNATWTNIAGATGLTFNTSQLASRYYRAIVTCTNGGNSSNSASVFVATATAISGTFTINNALPTGGTNFRTYNDAYNYIRCGINGPVVFNVVPGSGSYNEQLIMYPIPGASPVNTVTFNGNGTVLRYNSVNNNQRAVIKLDGADHVIFDGLVVIAPGSAASEFGYGIQLINNADSNIIRKTTININTISSSTNYAGVVINASATSPDAFGALTGATSLCNGNLFDGNDITGGYYGMTMIGSAGNVIGNTFINNKVKDFYTAGIYLSFTRNALVEANSVSRPNRTVLATFYGIYLNNGNIAARVNGNKIYNSSGSNRAITTIQYGINITNSDGTAAEPNIFSNNLIYDLNGAGGIAGIYNSNSDHAHIYHNTIALDNSTNNSSTTTRGFQQDNLAAGIIFRNNIVSIFRAGGGISHGIYLSTSNIIVSKNNNYFLSDSSTSFVGFSGGTSYSILADWQAINQDTGSVSFNPEYQDVSAGDYKPLSNLMDNLGSPVNILSDINKDPRSAATPDMGAFEYTTIACPNPPVPGTILSTRTQACLNVSFTLTIDGGVTGFGQDYQWQSSPDNVNWTNIPGAINRSLIRSQSVSTYYRIVYTCGVSVPSASILITTPPAVSGVYTINSAVVTGGTNFQSFNDAYNFLKCGINGPVVFNVVAGSGIYDEQLIMEYVPGSSVVNTVTFNGNNNTLRFASGNTDERAVIKLKSTRHIIFDGLVIDATAGTYGYGVQLTNNTDSNTVRNCTINISQTSPAQDFAGIVLSGSETNAIATGLVLSDNNSFLNNKINGGYYGITLAATFTGGGNGLNVIKGNEIKNFYQTGIYVAGSYGTIIDSNYISRPSRSDVGGFTGILLTVQKNTGNLITRNRISNPFGGALTSTEIFYGIHFLNSDGSIGGETYNENTVSNNLIYNINGDGAVYGIANTGSDYASYYHNTISLDNISSTSFLPTRGFSQTTAAGGIIFLNNIISITRGGGGAKHGAYLGAVLPLFMDHNDYFVRAASGSNSVGYYLANHTTLPLWRNALGNGFEQNSVSATPFFTDPAAGDFTPGNAGMNNKGVFSGITKDILDKLRDVNTPDLGAFEFTPPPCSVPPVNGLAIVSPDTACQNSPVYLSMDISGFGIGQSFQWQKSLNATGPFTNVGNPLFSADTTIIIDTTSFFRVAISCGSATIYSDTVRLVVTPALPGGTYTINKTAVTDYVPGIVGGNFSSFAAAKAAMGCGITGGPVVFNVITATGPYVEQLILDSIPGATATNNITFNGNGNIISFASNANTERAVIKLNGADHIIFDSLTIDASTGTFGYGVQLINNADSNTFRKNTIISSATATTTNFAGVVINSTSVGPIVPGATLCDFNTFDANTITGGNYGITLVGNIAASTYLNGNRFTRNTIKDFYNYGMYISGASNTLLEGNTFTRPARVNNAISIYGIYITTVDKEDSPSGSKLKINKNRFTNFFGGALASTATLYGIYYNLVDRLPANEDTVSNNLMYGLNGNGSIYGLYNNSSNNILYYHNTLSIDNSFSTSTLATVAFYQTGVANGLKFKNNIVTINRGGSGLKHGIYLNSVTSQIESDHNNYYVNGANAYAGFSGGNNQVTLDNLKAATNQEANSLSANPLYADSAAGNFRPSLALIDNKGTPLGIVSDIAGVSRSSSTPDIGAYEYVPTPCASPLAAGTATITPSNGLCLETPIRLNITGNSPLGSVTFQWQSSMDGTGNWTALGPLQYFPQYDTVTSTNTFYRARVICGLDTTYTNVVNITLNNILLSGTYTIDNSSPATYTPGVAGGNFQSFQTAVDAMVCGISGSVVFNVLPGNNGVYNEQVRIPYVPGTSASSTVTFQSAGGVASSVNLSYAGTAANNYTLRLDSTKNFIFRNLTFTAQNATFGRAIELINGASSDSIVNAIITLPVTASSSNTVAGIYASAFRGSRMVIKDNTITNGANGIYFSGVSNSVLTDPGHIITGNQVSGSYSHGLFIQFASRILVSNNNISLSGSLAPSTAGIYTNYADSSSAFRGNVVSINNVTANAVNGIVITNTRAAMKTDSTIVAGNRVVAGANNTGNVYGVTINASKGVSVVNNVIAINSAGVSAYGLYSQDNTGDVNFYNNTSNVTSVSSNGYPGYFTQNSVAVLNVRNNIFSHKGGGKALFVNNPSRFSGDYNMLYSSGDTLVKVASGPVPGFRTLASWKQTWNWDAGSISYEPAFADDTTLRPDLNNPDVWAMHGRGVQIAGNTYDFNNNPRVVDIRLGVPDLGAYEFIPAALPTVLLATPAAPAPNTTQVFSYGTDTVMKITWEATAPASVSVRRFSGVVPAGLPAGSDSMYFYTQVDVPGVNDYRYSTKLYYIDPWQGSIPNQNRLGLGRTTPSNAWIVGASSRIDVSRKEISQDALIYLNRFTGLLNPFAQPESEDSSSNRGKDFWVGYQRTNGFTGANGGAQTMKIYMGAGDVPANVTITIESVSGTPWVRNYFVPANTAITSDDIPKLAPDDTRLLAEGLYSKKGIHITSDVSIVAYAHIYEGANSGATMLLPTSVWGYEYYTLSSRQLYSSASYAAFHIVAQNDNTWVEVNPSKRTLNGWVPNGGTQPNGSYLIKLNKGDAYQVLGANLSGSEGQDLTGSYVKSIANDAGTCFPIGVFAGSTRTAIGCGAAFGSSGDLIIQQIFPYQAWGTRFLTAPTSMIAGPSETSRSTNIYRILVKDPSTVVRINSVVVPVAGLINGRYYQFESSEGDYIETDKPILLAQFLSSQGNCGGVGSSDPEMFYLSPVQQAIKKTQFYRNNRTDITANFITLVVPTEGLASLKIDNINCFSYPATERYIYDHPNLQGYSIVSKKWEGGEAASVVECELPFTGIVYGLGNVESYGYNIGTLVKNLNNLSSVNTSFNTGVNPTEYTCKGAPFTVTVLLPIKPTSIRWEFSKVPKLSPNTDSVQTNPVAIDSSVVNGITYYSYTVKQNFVTDTSGFLYIPVQYTSPSIEKCSQTETGRIVIQILPAPATDFSVSLPVGTSGICSGNASTFTGDLITRNGIAVNQWNWTFPGNSTRSGQVQNFTFPVAGTYPVTLRGITADGCISDTTKNLVVNPRPVVTITGDSLGACAGTSVTFNITNPEAGVTYNWYDAANGGNLVASGTSFTPASSVVLPSSFYVSGIPATLCESVVRKKVTIYGAQLLSSPVVTASSTPESITFTWIPVNGAVSYEVSTDAGTTFVTPTSGQTGLTHTISGLTPSTEITIIVKVNGTASCQTSVSQPVSGRTLLDQVFVPNTFTPNGDGRNDDLRVYGYVIKELKFAVFNQWGQKIYETTNPAMDATGGHIVWDGRSGGKVQPTGVYVYISQMVLLDGTTVNKKGAINLIR